MFISHEFVLYSANCARLHRTTTVLYALLIFCHFDVPVAYDTQQTTGEFLDHSHQLQEQSRSLINLFALQERSHKNKMATLNEHTFMLAAILSDISPRAVTRILLIYCQRTNVDNK